METSEEKKSAESKSKSQWFEVAVISLIAIVVLISGAWLWKMSDVLRSPPGHVEVRHVYANFSKDNKKGEEKEETQYTLYKQAEETLRGQMNTWLTIVGFFGVLFGLIVPLASYLLQRRSLSEEREQIKEQINKAAEEAAEKAAKKTATDTAKIIKDEIQQQIDDIRKDLKKVDGIRDEIEEMRRMVEDDRKTIALVRLTAQQVTEKLNEVKGVATKANEAVKSLSETISKGGGKVNASKSEFEKIKQKAEQGDAEAQNHLGVMYRYGNGVVQDDFEAVYWYRKAANQGYDFAQYNLGVAYDLGRGVDKDKTKAVYWYRQAAEQRNADAENNLAVMFEYGLGCEKDVAKALELYLKSAEHGSDMGRVNLGKVYEDGLFGVERDLQKAKELYRQVVDDPNACEKAKKLAQAGLDRIAKLEGGK